MSELKYVLFDFDGTLTQSVELALQIYNRIAPQYKCKPIDMKAIGVLSSGNPEQFFKQYGVTRFKLLLLVLRIRRELKKELHNLKPMPGISDVLAELRYSGYKLGIVTSNARKNVTAFLKNNEITDYFGFVRTAGNFFGKQKVFFRLLKRLRTSGRNVVYVGDETRDITASRKAGIHIISVCWGLTPVDALQAMKPDQTAANPSELPEKIRKVLNW